MAYWWVNHKQTYNEELKGGYIWSPQRNKNGARNQTYINLTQAKVGDSIFSYAIGEIKAVGIVEHQYQQTDRPRVLGKIGEQWDSDGWMVPIIWARLNVPLRPKTYISTIAPLLPEKNSPIQLNGNGNQSCYLAAINQELAGYLLQIIKAENKELDSSLLAFEQTIADELEQTRVFSENLPETEKEQLIKARRGQGLFRWRLEAIESACRLTGVSDRRFLVASHIKPWRDSNSSEKLDGNNGLLLSPHADKLFDRGWISFADHGKILCEIDGVLALMEQWRLDASRNVGPFNTSQKTYLAYHRDNVYQSSK